MHGKKIIKLFIPPIVNEIKQRFKKSHGDGLVPSPIPMFDLTSERMVILGNGPSLNASIEKYESEILKYDRIAVNFFASSTLFKRIKPNFYVIADPAFFDIPENQKKSMAELFRNLGTQTTWNMRVIVPLSSKDSPTIVSLKENPNISIGFYSNYDQNIGAMSKFEAWDKNYLSPPSQTVLNVALYLSLYWNYKETYLLGADMTFLEDIRIDQETNELFSIYSHFYDNKKGNSDKTVLNEKRNRNFTDWQLHEFIFSIGTMFKNFSELKGYADYKGLKIYNASEYSWINVFERRGLK